MKNKNKKHLIIISLAILLCAIVGSVLYVQRIPSTNSTAFTQRNDVISESVTTNINPTIIEPAQPKQVVETPIVIPDTQVIVIDSPPILPDNITLVPDQSQISDSVDNQKVAISTPSVSLPIAPIVETPATILYTSNECDSGFEATMLNLINAHRKENGVGRLFLALELRQVACTHSEWMISNGLSHTGINKSTPFERCERAETACWAENIAMNSNPSPQILFDQFKNSAGHNANMLNKNYTVVGIGYSGGFVTQLFR
jgi:uncharacterized protein YkwD